ncbi:MAG: response regulator [Nitrospirota bacterium]|nr:response regulator [Nitrospirota bacterium]
MTRTLKTKSLQGKLMAVIMGTSAGAVLLAGLLILIVNFYESRALLMQNLTIEAKVLAANSTAALAFDDQPAAAEALGHLRVAPQVLAAALYGHDGRLFASYFGAGADRTLVPARSDAAETYRGLDRLVVVEPVFLNGARIGTVFVHTDLRALYQQLGTSAAGMVFVAGLSLLAAFVAAMRLQRYVSAPVLALAQVANDVSERRDYSIRAGHLTDDEVGSLVDAFNSMLDQIQQRDRQLEVHRAQLQQEVEARTLELTQTNTRLQGEIDHRNRTEEALRQSQEQLFRSQKMEAIGNLTGGVAHEFNNLLQIIRGYGEMMHLQLSPEDPLRQDLEAIMGAGARGAALTSQLLAFSRRQVNQPKVLSLNRLVTELGMVFHRLLGENIELATNLDPALGSVKADRGQLEQVIINLVINARDAMPHGGTLTFSTANVELDEQAACKLTLEHPGSFVMFAVSDTGTGMDAATKARIFEPFFTTKPLGQGTGLGLSTVYGIVQQSHGSIDVESELGRGSVFRIYFPRVDEVAEPAEPIVDTEPPVVPSRQSHTIVLAEDEHGVRMILQKVLQAQGYHVLVASTGHEAIRLSQRHRGPLHLLVTDMAMPGMGGVELSNRLLLLYPEMKVLYMSGHAHSGTERADSGDSPEPFMQKPFSPMALVKRVRELLDRGM